MFANLGSTLIGYLYLIPAILMTITVHECAHGYVATLLGDPTAKNSGRLTLNPIAHFDPVGALCMLVFRFGWAKPVPINPYYFKNRRRDTAITALAGPLSNFLSAFVSLLIVGVCLAIGFTGTVGTVVINFFYMFCSLNIGLGVFNLIPIPPLDGSKVLGAVLPTETWQKLMYYERYGMLALIVLLYTGLLTRPLAALREGMFNAIASAVMAIIS